MRIPQRNDIVAVLFGQKEYRDVHIMKTFQPIIADPVWIGVIPETKQLVEIHLVQGIYYAQEFYPIQKSDTLLKKWFTSILEVANFIMTIEYNRRGIVKETLL